MFRSLLIFNFLVLVVSAFVLKADIVESNDMVIVKRFVNRDTLVLFNITDTLYEPSTTLANNQWRTFFADRVNANTSDTSASQKLIDKIKNMIVQNIPKKAVEEITAKLISDLQRQKITVLGITQKTMATSYADNFGFITSSHLLSIGIDLEKTLLYTELPSRDEEDNFSFNYGIIFTNKKPVGQALVAYLNNIKKQPIKIVMVDNSINSLEDSESASLSRGIEFTGIRYSRSDIYKENFDPDLGTIEFFAFLKDGKVMSDAEALELKKMHPEIDYQAMLDNYIRTNVY